MPQRGGYEEADVNRYVALGCDLNFVIQVLLYREVGLEIKTYGNPLSLSS